MINSSFLDPPEIEIDKAWVHGGIGYEVVISCLVYGQPKPQVKPTFFSIRSLTFVYSSEKGCAMHTALP